MAKNTNDALIKNYIDRKIKSNTKNETDELETINLKLIKNIINGEERYVDHIDSLEKDYNKSSNYFSFPASQIYIVFTSDKTFFLGFDTTISDNRKRFMPVGESVIKYEDMYNTYEDLVWIRLSDICKSEKYFSINSLKELSYSIEFLLEEYPDFYNKLFRDKKGIQKKITR